MKSSFNLSEWALEHRSLLWYFMIVFVLAGTFSYIKLGREEDPGPGDDFVQIPSP